MSSQRLEVEQIKRKAGSVLAAVALFSAAVNLLMLAVPLYMIQIYDRVLTSQSVETLVVLTVATITAIIFLALFDGIRLLILSRLGEWINRKLVPFAFPLPVKATINEQRSEIGTYQDIQSVRTFLGSSPVLPVFDAPFSPLFLIVVFLFHPLLGWIAATGMLILFAFAVASEFSSRKSVKEDTAESIAVVSVLESASQNSGLVRATGMVPALTETVERQLLSFSDVIRRSARINAAASAGAKAIRFSLQVAMLGCGAWLVIQQEISAGIIIAATVLMARALSPVEQAISSWKLFVTARSAQQRLQDRISQWPEEDGVTKMPDPVGRLTATGLQYRVTGVQGFEINVPAFEALPGQITGLVGATGSGKSTLARLLAGAIIPDSGSVCLDGVPLSGWSFAEKCRHVGYLPQDTMLFQGTVRQNISGFRPSSDDAVTDAAKLAGIHETIVGLPEKYETKIGYGGIKPSGGQSQKIALASAIFAWPKLVVLDEPNSNLDAVGEERLKNALLSLKERNHTIILVGHRVSLMQIADRVHVLSNGKLVTAGTPAELIARRRKAQQDIAANAADQKIGGVTDESGDPDG